MVDTARRREMNDVQKYKWALDLQEKYFFVGYDFNPPFPSTEITKVEKCTTKPCSDKLRDCYGYRVKLKGYNMDFCGMHKRFVLK